MLLNKVDLRPILKAHASTLTNNRFGGKGSFGDYALFFGAPALLSFGPLLWGFRFRVDAVNGFLNVFSLLTGLLLNLLVLVITLSSSVAPKDVDPRLRVRLVKEIFANTCFAVLVAVAVVCTALISLSYMRSNAGATTGPVATLALTALTLNFLLTLAMVLKRMFSLLTREIGKDASESRAA